jgi:hypothetical protein
MMKLAAFSLIALAGACVLVPLAEAQAPDPTTGSLLHRPMADGMVDPLELLAHLKAQLNLNTSQLQQFDAAVTQTQTARDTIQANMLQLRTALKAQVDTGAPDFDALAAQADTLQPQNLAARKQARSAWLALYDTFSSEQKGVVVAAIQARWARMQARMKK